MRSRIALITVVALLVTGCANMNTTQQYTLSGAALGAAGGAAIAAIADTSVAAGIGIGAAVGAGAGYLLSQNRQQHTSYYQNNHYRPAHARKTKPAKPRIEQASDQELASRPGKPRIQQASDQQPATS